MHPDGPREHPLRKASDTIRAELVAEELEDRRAGTDEEAVEVAGFDEPWTEESEPARHSVREGKRDADYAIEERDLLEAPSVDIVEADEQHPKSEEFNYRREKRTGRRDDKRGGILHLPAQRDADVAQIEPERVHPPWTCTLDIVCDINACPTVTSPTIHTH